MPLFAQPDRSKLGAFSSSVKTPPTPVTPPVRQIDVFSVGDTKLGLVPSNRLEMIELRNGQSVSLTGLKTSHMLNGRTGIISLQPNQITAVRNIKGKYCVWLDGVADTDAPEVIVSVDIANIEVRNKNTLNAYERATVQLNGFSGIEASLNGKLAIVVKNPATNATSEGNSLYIEMLSEKGVKALSSLGEYHQYCYVNVIPPLFFCY